MYAVTNVEGIGQATGSRRNLRQPLREPQPGHQLLVWCVILQLVAGMTEQLEIGNITASALRPWDDMIDGQISQVIRTMQTYRRQDGSFYPLLLLPLAIR